MEQPPVTIKKYGNRRLYDTTGSRYVNLDQIAEVRKTWQFFRDRRPDMYASLVQA